jgi:hypothetical protein
LLDEAALMKRPRMPHDIPKRAGSKARRNYPECLEFIAEALQQSVQVEWGRRNRVPSSAALSLCRPWRGRLRRLGLG